MTSQPPMDNLPSSANDAVSGSNERGSGSFTGPSVRGLVGGRKAFHFEIDAELIVFGKTEPDARVTLQNEPIKLRPDGTFTVRDSLPNARQVIPAVAASANGLEQRTVVLAVERNTKTMEPLIRDGGNNNSQD